MQTSNFVHRVPDSPNLELRASQVAIVGGVWAALALEVHAEVGKQSVDGVWSSEIIEVRDVDD
eukprot:498686-Amphidinium_carterae.1